MLDSGKMVQKIKDICKEKGINISELETELELSKGSLSRWVKSCPTPIETLYNLSTLLNVSSDYLLGIEKGSSEEILLGDNGKNRGESIKKLIELTNKRVISWSKISYSQAKKITVVSIPNDIVYKDNFNIYESITDKGHLILVHKKPDINNLYLLHNNDYLLLNSSNFQTTSLYEEIIDVGIKITIEFFNQWFKLHNNKRARQLLAILLFVIVTIIYL